MTTSFIDRELLKEMSSVFEEEVKLPNLWMDGWADGIVRYTVLMLQYKHVSFDACIVVRSYGEGT